MRHHAEGGCAFSVMKIQRRSFQCHPDAVQKDSPAVSSSLRVAHVQILSKPELASKDSSR